VGWCTTGLNWTYLTLGKTLGLREISTAWADAPDLERGPTKHGLLDDQPVWVPNRMFRMSLFGFCLGTMETTGSLGVNPQKWDLASKMEV
jgi:hypothetical protein